jgi:hypothetical protein
VRLRRAALIVLALLVGGALPGGPALAQDGAAAGYDFYAVRAQGDGVTVDFNLIGFLPIEDLVGLSSITSEAHLGTGRSDALAALPDPGDLILTLPGTLSALLGVSGLPDYAAAAHADHPSRPVDDVQLVPDVGLGAGRLHAEAGEDGSSAEAFVGHQVDTVGLLPSFSVGTIRTTAVTRRPNPSAFEATATTSVSDVRLLGGLLRIAEITSEVTVGVVNDRPQAAVQKVDVAGVTIAGNAIAVTDQGIVAPGQSTALGPVLQALLAPLLQQGIRIRTTPVVQEVEERTATASGGALEIEVPLDVQGYPGTLSVTLGKASAFLEIGPLGGTDAEGDGADGGGGGAVLPDSPLPGLGEVPSFGSGLPAPSGSGSPAGPSTGTEIVSVPLGRQVEDWDVTTLYRVLLVGGLALFAGSRLVVRSALRPVRRATDLRTLWRW